MHSILNMKYAVLGLLRLVRSFKNHSVTCRKRKACTIQPIMPDLPAERFWYKQPPFQCSGVEYFGPIYVPVRRRNEIIFFFTCLATRAVNLEIAPSLDTFSCLMGIEHFIALICTPSKIWSDSGKWINCRHHELEWYRSDTFCTQRFGLEV